MLTRLFELHSEVRIFLQEQQSILANLLYDPQWLEKLTYLADIFSCLNELNVGLQGGSLTVFDMHDKNDLHC